MNRLPTSFKQYFWDTEFAKIDPQKHWQYVITRLMDIGKEEAYRYMIKQYPRKILVEVLKTRRGISKKSANFWALYLGLDPKDVLCLRKEFPNPPVEVWPY